MPSKVSLPGAEHDREPTAEELKRELAEAREQQVATHELLRIIGQAHADPQSVLEAIARNAARLCGAKHTSIWRSDRGLLRAVATHNVSAERKRLIESNPIVPGRDSVVGRAALDRCTIHIADALADPELTYWTYKISNRSHSHRARYADAERFNVAWCDLHSSQRGSTIQSQSGCIA